MYRNERLTKALLLRIDRAEKRVVNGMQSTRFEHEPSITDRLLAYLESELDGHDIAGVHWEAKTLTSSGKRSQETRHGADFFGILDLRLPGYRVKKGFLAQAKRIEPGESMVKSEFDRMRSQCETMLDRSPVSYVFIYSQMSGIRIVSAIDILGADRSNPLDLTTWSLKEFFAAHIECFIGDLRISAANSRELEALADDVRARTAIRIAGSIDVHDIPSNRIR